VHDQVVQGTYFLQLDEVVNMAAGTKQR